MPPDPETGVKEAGVLSVRVFMKVMVVAVTEALTVTEKEAEALAPVASVTVTV